MSNIDFSEKYREYRDNNEHIGHGEGIKGRGTAFTCALWITVLANTTVMFDWFKGIVKDGYLLIIFYFHH
jgi:hypothetical protein